MNAVPKLLPHDRVSAFETEAPAFAWVPDLLSFLSRRRRILLCTTAATMLLGTSYALLAPPRFTASATILVDARRADMLRQEPILSDAQTLNALIESEVEVLRSEGLAREVATRLPTTGGHSAQPPSQTEISRATEHLMRMLSVHRIGLTYVIEIDVTAPHPDQAASLANAVVAAYRDDQLQAKTDATRLASTWLQERLRELRDKALDADRAVQAWKAEHGIVDTDHGLMDQQLLAELDSKLVSAGTREADARARLDRIHAVLAESSGSEGAFADAFADPVIVSLRQRWFDDRRQEIEWSQREGADHAVPVRLRHEMAELGQSIRTELERIGDSAGTDFEEAAASRADTEAQLDRLVRKSQATNEARVVARSLESAAGTYHSLYASFLQRYTEAAQDQSFPVSEVHVVSAAVPPLHKSAPKRSLILVGSTVGGLALGFAIAALVEILQTGLRRPEQVRDATGVDLVASLPIVVLRNPGRAAQTAIDDPASPFARALRRLHARLATRLPDSRGAVIAVAAAQVGDGASLVASNLAALAATSGSSVALLRVGQPASAPDIEGVRTIPFDPSTEVRSADFVDGKLAELRRQYHLVLLDLPALDHSDEAARWLRTADGLLLVLRAGGVSASRLDRLMRDLGLPLSRLLAVVLNRAAATS